MIGAGAFLRAAERLPIGDLDALLGPATAATLVFAPHPDDESLGCGGLLAACAAAKRTVRVIVASDGTGSHPRSRRFPAPLLAARRMAETRAAVTALGLGPGCVQFLGLPDTAVPDRGAALDAAVAAVLQGPARGLEVGAVVAAWRHDPHCDHGATWAIASAVAASLRRPATAAADSSLHSLGRGADRTRQAGAVPPDGAASGTAHVGGGTAGPAPAGVAASPPSPAARQTWPTPMLPAETVRLLAYPVWGWVYAHPIAGFPLPRPPRLSGAPAGWRLEVGASLPARRRAVAAHATQLGRVVRDDPHGFALPPRLLALTRRRYEVYLQEAA